VALGENQRYVLHDGHEDDVGVRQHRAIVVARDRRERHDPTDLVGFSARTAPEPNGEDSEG
jgi:hypothetical protein